MLAGYDIFPMRGLIGVHAVISTGRHVSPRALRRLEVDLLTLAVTRA